jgi:hypothetical protein
MHLRGHEGRSRCAIARENDKAENDCANYLDCCLASRRWNAGVGGRLNQGKPGRRRRSLLRSILAREGIGAARYYRWSLSLCLHAGTEHCSEQSDLRDAPGHPWVPRRARNRRPNRAPVTSSQRYPRYSGHLSARGASLDSPSWRAIASADFVARPRTQSDAPVMRIVDDALDLLQTHREHHPPFSSPSSVSRSTATTRSFSAVLKTMTPCVERPAMRMPLTGQRMSWPPLVTSIM